jgi:hypothetical protein
MTDQETATGIVAAPWGQFNGLLVRRIAAALQAEREACAATLDTEAARLDTGLGLSDEMEQADLAEQADALRRGAALIRTRGGV